LAAQLGIRRYIHKINWQKASVLMMMMTMAALIAAAASTSTRTTEKLVTSGFFIHISLFGLSFVQ
jgi:hypothetical protein